ncbi:MAG: hypothetical protein AAGK04_00695 [Planctomycetota bacterium]
MTALQTQTGTASTLSPRDPDPRDPTTRELEARTPFTQPPPPFPQRVAPPDATARALVAELTVERPGGAGDAGDAGDAGADRSTPEDEAVAWSRRVGNRVARLNAAHPDSAERLSVRVEDLRSSAKSGVRSARITLAFALPSWLSPETLSAQLRPIAPASSLLRCARPTELWNVPV